MEQTHNSKGDEIPRQPEGSFFPLYFYSYEQRDDGRVQYRHPHFAAGLTSLSVAFAAGVSATLGTASSAEAFVQNFLPVTAIMAGAGAVSMVWREKVKEHQQLIYFTNSALVVDSFGQKLQYFDLPDVEVEIVNVFGKTEGGGDFLQISDRHGERAFIGAFLPEEDLPDILMAINRGLDRHSSRRLRSFKQRYEARKSRGQGNGPRPDMP